MILNTTNNYRGLKGDQLDNSIFAVIMQATMVNSHIYYSKALRKLFFENGEKMILKKGSLVSVDDTREKVMYVATGFVSSGLRSSSDAQSRAMNIFGPSDVMSLPLLIENARKDIKYKCMGKATIYKLDRDVFKDAVYNNISLAIACLEISVNQNRFRSRRIENLSYRYVSDKLIYRIIYLAERYGKRDGKLIHIQVPTTHLELGIFINSARESVSREMEKLIKSGLITYKKQKITILEEQKLIDSIHETLRTDWVSN